MTSSKSMHRRLAERLSRDRVLKRHIWVNGKKTPIYVSPDAQLKYAKPGRNPFDADLIRLAERVGSQLNSVWDIGANVGVFTFASLSAGAKRGTVFEPDTFLLEVLKKTAKDKFYNDDALSIIPSAVSNQVGLQRFMVAARGRASNALETAQGQSEMGGVRRTELVPTFTIDSLIDSLTPPDFMKIDVEGAELLVLEGGAETIKRHRSLIYIEAAGHTFRAYRNFA